MLNLATIEDLKDMPTKGYVDAADSLIPFAQVDATSTATAFTATVAGITELRDGVIVLLKNGVVTSASGFTLNINNLGAKPVYSNMAAATRETTIFNVNYTLLFVYDSTRVEGGCWVNYRGYYSDANSIGYQLRTNSTVLKTTDQSRYYRMFFSSPDGTHWIPANTQKDNSATSVKTVNQRPIDPFGRIIYYSANTNFSAESDVNATYCWEQYAFALGYSFNRTGEALTLTSKAPVYIKCAPQSDGSAIIDSTTPYVQSLPSTADGKIYIFLGIAYSATAVELQMEHPVYYHDGTCIRLWTGKELTEAYFIDVTATNNSGVYSFTSPLSFNDTVEKYKQYKVFGYNLLVSGGQTTNPLKLICTGRMPDTPNTIGLVFVGYAYNSNSKLCQYSVSVATSTTTSTALIVSEYEGIDAATSAPIMDGTAAVGTSAKYAREDHVHPSDLNKADCATFVDINVTADASWNLTLTYTSLAELNNGNALKHVANNDIMTFNLVDSNNVYLWSTRLEFDGKWDGLSVPRFRTPFVAFPYDMGYGWVYIRYDDEYGSWFARIESFPVYNGGVS